MVIICNKKRMYKTACYSWKSDHSLCIEDEDHQYSSGIPEGFEND